MWADHVDPGQRDDALVLVDDELGYTWLAWREERLELADVHLPGDVDSCDRHRERRRRCEPASYRYDEALPDTYWDPAARVDWLTAAGLERAVCFPTFGLLWERRLSDSLPALTANMAAWNRWCASVVTAGGGRLHPVARLTLRDPSWIEAQLDLLSASGVRLAMVAPAPVEGRPLSHPDHDRLWSAFVHHGISPVFHVADQPRMFDDCWYTDPGAFVPTIESVFLWVLAALALADLIINGVLERHPELRIGVVELGSIRVPQFLLMLDGATEFTSRLKCRAPVPLRLRPNEYFARQVRVSSFAYEDPARSPTKTSNSSSSRRSGSPRGRSATTPTSYISYGTASTATAMNPSMPTSARDGRPRTNVTRRRSFTSSGRRRSPTTSVSSWTTS